MSSREIRANNSALFIRVRSEYLPVKIKANLAGKCYTILVKGCIIHTSPSALRFLIFRFLNSEGVSPVFFLNWFDKWATLL